MCDSVRHRRLAEEVRRLRGALRRRGLHELTKSPKLGGSLREKPKTHHATPRTRNICACRALGRWRQVERGFKGLVCPAGQTLHMASSCWNVTGTESLAVRPAESVDGRHRHGCVAAARCQETGRSAVRRAEKPSAQIVSVRYLCMSRSWLTESGRLGIQRIGLPRRAGSPYGV